jgi:hypothetical protein
MTMKKKLAALLLTLTLVGGVPVLTSPPAQAAQVQVVQKKPTPSQYKQHKALKAEAKKFKSPKYIQQSPGVKVYYLGLTKKSTSRDGHVWLFKSKAKKGYYHKYLTVVDMQKAMSGRSCHCITGR